METGRYKTFNFKISLLAAEVTKEKLKEVFNKLSSVAKNKGTLDFFFVMSKQENIGVTTQTKKLYLRN